MNILNDKALEAAAKALARSAESAMGLCEGEYDGEHYVQDATAAINAYLSALTNTSGDDGAPVAWLLIHTDVDGKRSVADWRQFNSKEAAEAHIADQPLCFRKDVTAQGLYTRPQSAAVRDEALPEKPDYKVLKAIAWMKVDPGSRAFEDTKGELEIIGYKRAEQIYAAIRAALHSTQEG